MIAYLIMVHRYPRQFMRLFKSIYTTDNCYLIHVDKKTSVSVHLEIKEFLRSFNNAYILTSSNVLWGGYSMVDVELRGIKKLLQLNKQWDHYINLSGQDFPLQTQTVIEQYLQKSKQKNFIKILNQVKKRPVTLNRIENYFVESNTGFIGKPHPRAYMPDTIPYIGGQWKILTRACCEFVTKSPQVNKFKKFYKNTLIADESFFQTVFMNTDFGGKIINDDKRAIIWVPDINIKIKKSKQSNGTTKELVASGKIKLRPKSFTIRDKKYLLKSNAFFARKFDEVSDSKILSILEAKLTGKKEISSKHLQHSNFYTVPLT